VVLRVWKDPFSSVSVGVKAASAVRTLVSDAFLMKSSRLVLSSRTDR